MATISDPSKAKFQELENAMERVISAEKLKLLKTQEEFKNVIKAQTTLKATQILARKELYEASRKANEEEIFLDETDLLKENIRLREERDQLHKALLRHQSFASIFQEAVFKTQIQDNFYKCLEEDKANLNVRTIIEHSNDNLLESSVLAKTLNETEGMEKEILHSRLKYRRLLDSIEKKWNILNRIGAQEPVHNYPSDNPELKEFEEKLNKRQERLELLINLLQCFISSSGEKWGANPRLVEIMLLCDSASNLFEGSEDINQAIDDLRKSKDVTEKKNPLEKFISSTTRR